MSAQPSTPIYTNRTKNAINYLAKPILQEELLPDFEVSEKFASSPHQVYSSQTGFPCTGFNFLHKKKKKCSTVQALVSVLTFMSSVPANRGHRFKWDCCSL